MKKLLSLVLLLALPALAYALEDPRPDVMGFFFDQSFPLEENTAQQSVPFMVYAVLMNPSMSTLDGLEFGYDHEVPPGKEGLLFRLATNYPPGAISTVTPWNPLVGTYALGLATPMPTSSYTVLMSWQYMLLDDFVMGFHMTGGDPSSFPGGAPGYALQQTLVPCAIAQTCFGTGAYVNSWCPVDTEEHSWGTLKGLYR